MNTKKILLIQFRQNNIIASHEQRCILRGLGIKENLLEVMNFFNTKNNFASEIDLTQIKGVIIGGSGEFSFSDKENRSDLWKKVQNSFPFLKKIMESDLPILGICFGHQILGYLLGSEVINDKMQEETGSFEIALTQKGLEDRLFSGLPEKLFVQEGHKDSLAKIPDNAILLAQSKKCSIEAFRAGNIYGVQFHPELEIDDVYFRLKNYPDYAVGKKLEIRVSPSPLAKKILQNFLVITDNLS